MLAINPKTLQQHQRRNQAPTTEESSHFLRAIITFGVVMPSDKSAYIKQLNQRHKALAWWARTIKQHPLGVVPISTAARILHVTPNRVRQLIETGRLSCLDTMPGGSSHDRFVPVEELLDAPFAMTRGRPGVFGPKNRQSKRKNEETQKDYNRSDYSSLGQE
tara:strand:- start:48 stop:533 length:486 start_codon:yes stop_codon:yes gene_type:complete